MEALYEEHIVEHMPLFQHARVVTIIQMCKTITITYYKCMFYLKITSSMN